LLLAAFGVPGSMSTWGFDAVRALTEAAWGPFATIETDAAESFMELASGHPNIVLLSQYPQPALLDRIDDMGGARLLFLEDPSDALDHLTGTSHDEISLVRTLSASLACLAPLPQMAGVLVLHRDMLRAHAPDKLLDRLEAHLGEVDPGPAWPPAQPAPGNALIAERGALLESAVRTALLEQAPPIASRTPSQPVRDLAADVLRPLETMLRLDPATEVVWPRSSFLLGDRPDQFLSGPVELAGGARCLVYGPYFHLPRGRWNARMLFGFSDRIYEQGFVVELHGSDLLERVRFDPPGPGLFAGTVQFDVTEPQTAIELRIFSEIGAIEGELTDLSVRLSPAPDDSPPMQPIG